MQELTSLTEVRDEQVGLENVEAKDMVLPRLSCLQGMSKQVADGVPGAAPGKFYLSSTGEVIEGPLRVLIVHHHKSRALFPDERKPEMAGLESCFSNDALIGTRYGDCFRCKYKDWGKDRKPPLCKEAHDFVVLTKNGPAVLKLAGTSYAAGSSLVSGLKNDFSRPNMWDFPAVITAVKAKSWAGYTVDIRLDRQDPVPPSLRAAARKIYDDLNASFQVGKLSSAESGQPGQESDSPIDEDNIPF